MNPAPTAPSLSHARSARSSRSERLDHPPERKLSTPLERALAEWETVLTSRGVRRGSRADHAYGSNTLAMKTTLPAALRPDSVSQIKPLLRIARRHKVALYPVSTGRNWGYGSALPPCKQSVVLDLSRLDKILSFDRDLGLVTLQPGVTQRMLEAYLREHDLPYLIPVTGAGPDASLLGNALERGYGITPHADHFGAVMALEAVLPNGETYRSALAEAGGETPDRIFKWGLGPYLDGLFTQGNFGIVTQVTLALAPRPERTEGFFFSLKNEEAFEGAVLAIREILRKVGGVTGSVNLMNARRVLAMTDPYPVEQVEPGRVIPDDRVKAMARRRRLTAWTGVGAIYGPPQLVKATRRLIKAILKPYVKDLLFITPGQATIARRVINVLPFLRRSVLADSLKSVEATLQHMAGKPSNIALPLAYWKNRKGLPVEGSLHPAQDGCGLIWFSPLVPLVPDRVRKYTQLVERICRAHGMEPLITLTSLSSLAFDSTVPLLFDRDNPDEVARAHACCAALYEAGRSEGFLPYRAGIQSMAKVVDPSAPFWKLGARLKGAVDPDGIIAPGRYSIC